MNKCIMYGDEVWSFWEKNPEIKQEVLKYYPFIGAKPLSDKFGINQQVVFELAKKHRVKRLPHGKRHCKNCWDKKTEVYQNFCLECGREKSKNAERRRCEKNPIKYRLINIYNGMKARMPNRHLEFPKEYLFELYEKQGGKCYYTGRELVAIKVGEPHSLMGLSIDRIDPSKPYTKDNIVLCGSMVNRSKSDLSQKEFYKMCVDIVKNLNGKSLCDGRRDEYFCCQFNNGHKQRIHL